MGRWLLVVMGLSLAAGCAGGPLRVSSMRQRAASTWYLRGLMLERSSQLPEALDAYREALAQNPSSPYLHVRIGAAHLKLGRTEPAMKSFQRALSLDGANTEALRWMAIVYSTQGRLDEATDAYEQLVRQEPTDRFMLSTLADLYVMQDRLVQATRLYDRLIREQGSSYQLHFNLGALYGQMGQLALAQEELSRAIERRPDSIEARVALGLAYELDRQLPKALAHYEEAVRMEPLNPRLYHHAARAAAALDLIPEAIRHYETVLDLAPNDLDAVMALVRLWVGRHRFEEAQHLLARKLSGGSHRAELYLMLGMLYREAGAWMEALRAFERASALAPKSAQTHFLIGAQLERLHREEAAREELRQAIELDPRHADALNYLGYMNAEDGVALEEARTLIQRALEVEPDNGAYLDSLGWVYFRMGDMEQAQTQLERAASLVDTDPTIFEHLGDVYFALGDLDNARRAWRKALKLDDDLETIKQKLRQPPMAPLLMPTPQ